MDYYLGGYYLVEGVPRPKYAATFLPSTIWSLSSCVCPVYPDTWALPWSAATSVDRIDIQTRLGLTAAAFQDMQAWVEAAFNDDRFGWRAVWLDQAYAQQYYERYLQGIPQIKLLAIALPTPHLDACLADATPKPGYGESGLYQLLLKRQKLSNIENALGFEILGVEFGYPTHSFLCNSLETDYKQELNLTFNDHGLLASYAEAQRAAEFTNLDTTAAEPIPWYPWLIVEFPLAGISP